MNPSVIKIPGFPPVPAKKFDTSLKWANELLQEKHALVKGNR